MTPKITLFSLGVIALIAAVWYSLKNTGPKLVTTPNTQASGVPAYQSPAITYNIGSVSPAPTPALIYGTPPPLPTAPAYLSYNQSPANLLGLTPQGAAATTVTTPGTAAARKQKNESAPTGSGDGCGCGCPTSCGCASYQDGNQGTCLASNPAQQAASTPPALLQNLSDNINSSVVTMQTGQLLSGASPSPSPIAQAAAVPSQAAALAQNQAAVAPTVAPPSHAPAFSWPQIGKLLGLNSGDLSRFDQLATQFPGGQ